MKLCEILGLNAKLKNDDSKFSPIVTVKKEEKVSNMKYDRHGMSPSKGLFIFSVQ